MPTFYYLGEIGACGRVTKDAVCERAADYRVGMLEPPGVANPPQRPGAFRAIVDDAALVAVAALDSVEPSGADVVLQAPERRVDLGMIGVSQRAVSMGRLSMSEPSYTPLGSSSLPLLTLASSART